MDYGLQGKRRDLAVEGNKGGGAGKDGVEGEVSERRELEEKGDGERTDASSTGRLVIDAMTSAVETMSSSLLSFLTETILRACSTSASDRRG